MSRAESHNVGGDGERETLSGVGGSMGAVSHEKGWGGSGDELGFSLTAIIIQG